MEIVGPQQDNLEVFEIHDVARVVDQGQRVAGQKVLALADAENKRTAAPRADEEVGHIAMHHRDPVSPVHLAQGQSHGLDEMIGRGFAELDGELPDEMRQHLGVRLGVENVPLALEFGAELFVVLDHAIVDQHNTAALIGMRVRVFFGHRAMRGPAGVADSAVAVNRVFADQLGEVLDAADGPADFQRAIVAEGHAGGIITAIFETTQPVQKDGRRLGWTNVTDNATHK